MSDPAPLPEEVKELELLPENDTPVLAALRRAFDKIDEDGTGFLNREEVTDLVKRNNTEMPDE